METMGIKPEYVKKLGESMRLRLQRRYGDALDMAITLLRNDARTKMFLFGDEDSRTLLKKGDPLWSKWTDLKEIFEVVADPEPLGGKEGVNMILDILKERFSDASGDSKTTNDVIQAMHDYAGRLKRGDFGNKLS